MKLFPDPNETIEGVGRALRAGERTCVDVLESCLAKIDEWEPQVHAWVVVDREGAMEQARRLDEELKAGKCRGPLHGIPIGIKDIIDVAGLPTAAGFRPWRDRVAEDDAYDVSNLRDHGAIILGKTVTTQFAWIDPPVTRNPWNRDRTPGGSSSGSATAVACGMCLGALGTQTGGSIIRPASFCGIAGAKPFRWFPMHQDGILEFAPSLDHLGPLARTVRDLHLVWVSRSEQRGDIYQDDGTASPERVEELIAELWGEREEFPLPPKLGCLSGFFERRTDPMMWRAFQQATNVLAGAGAEVSALADPLDFEDILRHHRIIMAAEAAAGHARRYREAVDDYLPRISALIEEGLPISAADYLHSRAHQREQRRKIWAYLHPSGDCPHPFGGHLLMPATIGPAPSLETTGDPCFNSPWSYTGSCEVSFPIGLSANGLPLAIQVVGAGSTADTLAVASWCENVIRSQFV